MPTPTMQELQVRTIEPATDLDLAAFKSLLSRLNAEQQEAVTRAREDFNMNLPPVYDEEGNQIDPNPYLRLSDEEYWYFVFRKACESYVVQFPDTVTPTR